MGSSDRSEIHQILDNVPDERLEEARQLLEELTTLSDSELSPETAAAIEEGLDDIRRGNTISVEEYRRSRGL